MATTAMGPNPAFMIRHPKIPNLLYVTTECIQGDGDISTYEIQANGNLSLVSRQSTEGKSTCYANLLPGMDWMVLVSYWDAKLALVPVDARGGLGATSQVLMQPAAEYVQRAQPSREEHWTFRQRWPHSHCCVTEPYQHKTLFVTDLGLDTVFAYQVDPVEGRLVPKAEVQLKKGRGPRHMVFHPQLQVAFLGNELESTVTVLKLNHKDLEESSYIADESKDPASLLHEIQTLSTLPEDFQNEGFVTPAGVWKAASHSSEIRLHPNGRFLYNGNRGHDSIAVFSVDEADGSLTLVEVHSSGGKTPRNFNFDMTGRFMVVGNQDTNTLNVFEIDLATGKLTETHTVPMPSPNFVYAMPAVR